MSAFFTIAVIHFLALISPGPDFIFISRQSIAVSRKAALLGAAGIGLSNLVHVGYCILGIGLVISKSILLFNLIKYAGAMYLIYIGWKSLSAAKERPANISLPARAAGGAFSEVMAGFLCNILNPKCTLFFLALFTQVISPSTPLAVLWLYGLYIALASFLWFACVASVFSLRPVRACYERIQHRIEQTMGAMLVALGVRIALARD